MNKAVLAAQLYTVRAFTQTTLAFADSMRKIRQIGYCAVQVSGIGPIPPAEVKQVLDANGLAVCITHTSFDRLRKDLPSVIAEHRQWNCQHVALGSMPAAYRESGEEGYRLFVREAVDIGRQLADSGLTFSYHNHSFEFERFGKRTGLDVIYEESDPRFLRAEIDTYWVQHGGADPVQWILKMKNRMPVVHLKDMVIWKGQQTMAEIGEGNMNWPAILDACQKTGVQWYAVEQDECQRDPFESLAISYRNLAAMGLS